MTDHAHGPVESVDPGADAGADPGADAAAPVADVDGDEVDVHEGSVGTDVGDDAGTPDAGTADAGAAAGDDAGAAPVELSGPPSERLAQLGLVLPPVPAPLAEYVPAVRTGSYVHTSGQLPFVDGVLSTTGVVGDQAVDVSAELAAVLARQCALNAVAAVASVVDLDSVVRVVKVTGFVASAPGFVGQPVVVNGASQLLGQVFGEAGRHARSAVGVASLPLGAPVEVEITVEVG